MDAFANVLSNEGAIRIFYHSMCRMDLSFSGPVLQESLGGNAKTSLVVAVADARESIEETLQALNFGSRAMRVKVCHNLSPAFAILSHEEQRELPP